MVTVCVYQKLYIFAECNIELDMKKHLFFLVAIVLFTSCVSEQLNVSRYIKEYDETSVNVSSIKPVFQKYDTVVNTSIISNIRYYSNLSREMNAIITLEDGYSFEVSVANGILNDPNLIGREFSYYQLKPLFKNDTVFEYDSVLVCNLLCREKIIEDGNYIVKVYDFVTQRNYKVTTDKATFDRLEEAPVYVRVKNKNGKTEKYPNNSKCIPWDYAVKLKGHKLLQVVITDEIYRYKPL